MYSSRDEVHFNLFFGNPTIENVCVMAVRTFTASEVLDLLEDQEQLEDEVDNLVSSVNLDAESEDDDLPEGNGFGSDRSATLSLQKI